MRQPHLYFVILRHPSLGGVYVRALAAANKREAIAAVREEAAWMIKEPITAFRSYQCYRIDAVDGYDVILRRKVDKAGA